MEEKLRDILSIFIKIPASEIYDATPIGRSAVKNSILLHRLYAKLATEGIVIDNYSDIDTFGALRKKINGYNHVANEAEAASSAGQVRLIQGNDSTNFTIGIGIDIEEISAMPRVDDLREEPFYTMNFTPAEISYSILQKDTYPSLAGLFAAKEAIVKADNTYRERRFSDISITYTVAGKPFHAEFELSISHSGNFAVAVAVCRSMPGVNNDDPLLPVNKAISGRHYFLIVFMCLVAIVISILAILMAWN